MSTALGRRSGAVYGEKSPKTSFAPIYCYGNTLNIVNLIDSISVVCVVHCIRRMPPVPLLRVRFPAGFFNYFILFYLFIYFFDLKFLFDNCFWFFIP